MDPKIAKKTQDTLGKIIKKPPLTDKLLGKPPFRFLHDIMTSIIKTTGFMQGLFSETEMNSENVKDKDAKIAFLQKAIDIVCAVTGKELHAKPVKIVAGHEPERTNEFLQALADAINKNVDNDDYVKRVLKGGKAGGPSKEEKKEDKKERLKSEEKRKGHDSESKSGHERDDRKQSMDRGDQDVERKHERDREKDRHREKRHDKEKDRHGEKRQDRDGEKDKERHKDRDRESKARDKSREGREERHRETDKERSKKRDQSRDKENESPDREKMKGEKEEKQDPPTRLQRPASAKGSRRRREEDEDIPKSREPMLGEGDLPPQVASARQLARPSSARPAPPRPKQDTLESEPAMRLGTGHPTNVIADNDDDDDDDES
uniref:TRAF3-interacting protein 1 n=1 Tax=Arion vulgaris TaxID=1028688 RepID=A0A0B7BIW7_9EUPU